MRRPLALSVRCRLAVAGVALLAAVGCGRKAAPLPPEIRVADPTRDLTVVQDDTVARLEWSYPQMTTTGGPLADLEGIEIWRAAIPLAQEPQAGTSRKDHEMRWNLLETRGEVIGRLEGDPLDLASHGSKVRYADALDSWISDASSDSEWVVWYAVRSVCCRGRKSDFSNIARVVPVALDPAPAGLEVTPQSDGLHLTWPPTDDTLCLVERSDDGTRWTAVSQEPVDGNTWIDTRAAQGQRWFYRLRTVRRAPDGTINRMGAPGPAVEVAFPDIYPPESPADLVCLPEGGPVRLRWRASAGATGYSIHRRVRQEDPVVLVEGIPDLSYLDREPPEGNLTYIVAAMDDAGNASTGVRCRTIVEQP